MQFEEPSNIQIGTTRLYPTYRADLRTTPPDVFEDISSTDFSQLRWDDIGRPYKVENYSIHRRQWEEENGPMPVEVQWQHFNRSFDKMLNENTSKESKEALARLFSSVLDPKEAYEAAKDLVQTQIWNNVHRVQDAVWDPRGKRALWEGIDLKRPKILFIGASDNYEGMQLQAMYPGGNTVAVDYDEYCRTTRFGKFPESYPFLGRNPSTGGWKVYHRPDFNVDYIVDNICNIDPDEKFDVVMSVGFLEHVPDENPKGLDKPKVIDLHKSFLKPGGYAIITTPRDQRKTRLFYKVMGEKMNFGYRELMNTYQLGKYVSENGFKIERAGYIKGHNGIIAKAA